MTTNDCLWLIVGVLDNDTIRKRIGQRIADARGERSRRDVAAAVGVSVQALSQWEAGDTTPTLPRQIALALALETPWSDLFNPEDVA